MIVSDKYIDNCRKGGVYSVLFFNRLSFGRIQKGQNLPGFELMKLLYRSILK